MNRARSWPAGKGQQISILSDFQTRSEDHEMPGTIMIIRHVEKPQGQTAGVTIDGEQDEEELTVRGWQRAGALVRFFAPVAGASNGSLLTVPKFIFASG